MIWRPRQHVVVKALGLLWRGDSFLVAEVCVDTGTVDGLRPLGGTVEFGEPWQQTLVRELHEELGIACRIVGAPLVLENLYEFEVMTGHEVLFVAEVEQTGGPDLPDEPFEVFEDNGAPFTARWVALADFEQPGALPLYPDGLLDFLCS